MADDGERGEAALADEVGDERGVLRDAPGLGRRRRLAVAGEVEVVDAAGVVERGAGAAHELGGGAPAVEEEDGRAGLGAADLGVKLGGKRLGGVRS